MITLSNSVTRRLEGFARKMGRELHVLAQRTDSQTCLYHVTGEDGRPWRHWVSLGYGRTDAMRELDCFLAQ